MVSRGSTNRSRFDFYQIPYRNELDARECCKVDSREVGVSCNGMPLIFNIYRIEIRNNFITLASKFSYI